MTDAEIIAVLEARFADAIKSRDFTREWYSVRFERLKDLLKDHGIWKQGADIIANASTTGDLGNDYWQQLNMMRHRAERAEEALRGLRLTARVLLQNAEGCVEQHHGATSEPGWLRDSRLKIEAAEAVLKD